MERNGMCVTWPAGDFCHAVFATTRDVVSGQLSAKNRVLRPLVTTDHELPIPNLVDKLYYV